MNDAKTKLGQVEPYEYDASKFKGQLKANLMREYRKKYGVEEVFEAAPERKPFFSFGKLAFAPVMAVLVLAVFIGYEYVSQPMTAYAYLKKVEKHHKQLKKHGVKVHTTHIVDGYELEVESVKDKAGNIQVRVVQDDVEVENFVMKDGILYIDEDLKEDTSTASEVEVATKVERAEDLSSILSSLVLAEIADPQDEWTELISKEGVEFEELEDDFVNIKYEEEIDGEVFVNELVFKDFEPVSKLRTRKVGERLIARGAEEIKYHEVAPLKDKVVKPETHIVFIENPEFNDKITEFVEEEVEDLIEEYVELPEKDSYFTVWNDRKEEELLERRQIALIERSNEPALMKVMEEASHEEEAFMPRIEVEPPKEYYDADATVRSLSDVELPEAELPEIAVNKLVEREMLDKIVPAEPEGEVNFREVTLKEVGGGMTDRSFEDFTVPTEKDETADFYDKYEKPLEVVTTPKESKPVVRDAYLEEVFYDLLEDKKVEEPVKEDEKEDDKEDEKDDVLREKEPVSAEKDPVEGFIDKLPEKQPVETYVPPRGSDVKEPSVEGTIKLPEKLPEIKLPEDDSERDLDAIKDSLIDKSIPEPYMSEPIDPVIIEPYVPSYDDKKDEAPSYTELIKLRSDQQEDAAEERLKLRMEKEAEILDVQPRIVEPEEPKSEFRR